MQKGEERIKNRPHDRRNFRLPFPPACGKYYRASWKSDTFVHPEGFSRKDSLSHLSTAAADKDHQRTWMLLTTCGGSRKCCLLKPVGRRAAPGAGRQNGETDFLFQMTFPFLLLCLVCSGLGKANGLKKVVKPHSIVPAAFGGEANLSCNFSLSAEVYQVTWQKINGSFFQTIATYSSVEGLSVIGSFQKKVHFTPGTSKASAITLQNLTFDDESYYRCTFNAFRHSPISKDILLSIQTISELTVELDSHLPTEGLLAAVCSATGKPAPNITWLDDRGLDVSPQIHYIQNRNGTVTVASRLTFSANHLHALHCLLEHPQGRQKKALPLEQKGEEGAQKIIIIVLVVIAVLLIIVMICCVVRLINRRRKNQKSCSAPRTPAKETGLHQDLGDKASVSLHTPPDQHIVHQNEEQTRSTSLHKRQKRNRRKQKNCRCLFSEEAEKLNSNSPTLKLGLRVDLLGYP